MRGPSTKDVLEITEHKESITSRNINFSFHQFKWFDIIPPAEDKYTANIEFNTLMTTNFGKEKVIFHLM